MDPYSPVKGKCQFWRELPNEEDRYDPWLAAGEQRVMCCCWIDGDAWMVTLGTVPDDCPKQFHCRYYVKSA
jgi:hypothetical protein